MTDRIPAGATIARTLRRYPVTAVVLALVVATSAVGIAMRVAHATNGTESFGPLRVFAASTGAAALLLTLAGVVVLVGASERLMGSWRTAVAFVLTTVVGTGLGALSAFVDLDGRDALPLLLGRATSFDPWTAVVGTIATASAFAGPLWRRRIRVNTLAVVAALFLYAGHASDLYAVLAAAAGWALGELLRRTPKRTGWTRSSHRETRVLLGTAVLVSAIGPVIALVSRARVGLLAPLAAVVGAGPVTPVSGCTPDTAGAVARTSDECLRGLLAYRATDPWTLLLAIPPLLVLVVGGLGLFRGSRFAVWLVVVVDTVTAIAAAVTYGAVHGRAHAVEDQFLVTLSIVASVAVPLATAVVLVALRRSFTVLPTRRRVAGFTVVVLVAAGVLVSVMLVVADAAPIRVDDPWRIVVAALGPIAPVTFWERLPTFDPGLRLTLGIAGPLLWLVVAIAAVRPTGAAPADTDADGTRAGRDRARALLIAGGGDTFGWMTTWRGNAYWFAEDGRAGIAYRRNGTVAVTLGGPFGYGDAREPALAGFARYCDDNGWTPVFYGVDESVATPLRALGWGTLPVAEDADFDPRDWTTSGKQKQDVRTAVNRAAREGTTATWGSWHELPASTTRQIEAISEAWVAERELPEMGFTLGGVDEMRDPAVRTLVAQDAAGTVLAVTSWLPSHREGRVVGWTLDVMRRTSTAPNGVMEFLVASAADRMRNDGIERLSLSAAPLAQAPEARAVDTAAPADGVQNLLDLVGGVLEPVYGFRSLLRFKRKFGPELHPLVLAYPDPVALPAIGVAVVRAYLPDLSLRQAVALARGRG
ncbi:MULTISPECIES: bifunctional lysylphosphatidylglycerol flippase/synthetase MprF [unclassified Curtobacterium]|uniref:bifunctional lysylphosphatidylglycerol flippase/synthetase MprF n=1 Tax=unclassified Curtobacterium TaxID=257496 RepID=UPI00381C7D90